MRTKITLSKDYCEMDAIKYVASRYRTTPEKVLKHYFVQTGIIPSGDADNDGYERKNCYRHSRNLESVLCLSVRSVRQCLRDALMRIQNLSQMTSEVLSVFGKSEAKYYH